ncbi:MAG: hypothetical protein ACFWT4_24450 [Citrobacter braakii]|jgi:hypothetical protein
MLLSSPTRSSKHFLVTSHIRDESSLLFCSSFLFLYQNRKISPFYRMHLKKFKLIHLNKNLLPSYKKLTFFFALMCQQTRMIQVN